MSMTKTPKFEAVLAHLRELRVMYAADEFDEDVARLESPIEKIFLGQMLAHFWWASAHDGDVRTFDRAADECREAGLILWPNEVACDGPTMLYVQKRHREGHFPVAVTQPWIEMHGGALIRPDFAFILPGEHATKVIVELDGHDFHERTPEQAQKDKSRDRALQRRGWHVLRFTGREVLRDPSRCLQEVESLLIAKAILARRREEAEK